MINFQIYKAGKLIKFEDSKQMFENHGFQTLFIFHGLFGRGKNWQTFCKRFSHNENYIVITVDLRNHGRNQFKKNLSYFLMVKDIVELFKHLGIQKTNLLGHSMGGKLAMLITLLYPKFVSKIIIVDISPIDYPNDNQNLIDILLKLDLNLIKNRNHADDLLSKYIDQKFLRLFLLQNLELVDGEYKWALDLISIKKAMKDLRSFPRNDKVYQVETKALCIYGEKSNYVNEKFFPIFKNYFPNILFHKIKKVGHLLHIESPDEFYHVSLSFLKN
ncbi:alpha/beta fold hydrolase [Alphaproteobacteria bacterium]|nr:alpha/beta fold hydrolase [Alphaproteobacteria bacterium]